MSFDEKLRRLQQRGIEIPAPHSIEIADDVQLDRVHGPKTVLHAGARLRGARLLVSPGCSIGSEGPATVENCALGRNVTLGGGYFADSVLLEGASMGLGAHVRPGSLLEEQASGAHTVGLKQTILLPFVTLGSLINFCDILMAGGTSRRDHSEIGSSFIHFNFTPHGRHGDKATPSLVGDVPRGVMLRSPRIFLGGQAGLVGPVQIGYGTVLAAGFVYRRDYGSAMLAIGERIVTGTREFSPLLYPRVTRRVEKNLRFLGNLAALWHWYEHVRIQLAGDDGLLVEIYRAGQQAIERHFSDRVKQIDRLASYMEDSISQIAGDSNSGATERNEALIREQRSFATRWPAIKRELTDCRSQDDGPTSGPPRALREGLARSATATYLDAIRALDGTAVQSGSAWLDGIVSRIVKLGASV